MTADKSITEETTTKGTEELQTATRTRKSTTTKPTLKPENPVIKEIKEAKVPSLKQQIQSEMKEYQRLRDELALHFQALRLEQELISLRVLIEALMASTKQPATILAQVYQTEAKRLEALKEAHYLSADDFAVKLQSLPAMLLEASWPMATYEELKQARLCQIKPVDVAYQQSLSQTLVPYYQQHAQYVALILAERDRRGMSPLVMPTYPKLPSLTKGLVATRKGPVHPLTLVLSGFSLIGLLSLAWQGVHVSTLLLGGLGLGGGLVWLDNQLIRPRHLCLFKVKVKPTPLLLEVEAE